MIPVKLYYAKVIDNNDTDKKGKIQIQVLPEMIDVNTLYLPWIRPLLTQGNKVPENDDFIYVMFFDEIPDWKEGFYLPQTAFYDGDDKIDYSTVMSTVTSTVSELGTQTYPNPEYRKYDDGTITFHNTVTGERGVYHNSGSYTLIDANGNIYLRPGTNKVYIKNSTYSLNEILADLQSVIQGLVTPLNIIDSTGAPCTYLNAGTDLPKIQTALTKINNLLGG